jgi:hypothetical protein
MRNIRGGDPVTDVQSPLADATLLELRLLKDANAPGSARYHERRDTLVQAAQLAGRLRAILSDPRLRG